MQNSAFVRVSLNVIGSSNDVKSDINWRHLSRSSRQSSVQAMSWRYKYVNSYAR